MKKIKVLLADPRHETVGTHSYFVPIGIGYIGSNLLKEFKNKPKNLETLCNLADKYFAENMLDDAFELLLNNYKNNKEAVKKKILEFFEALGNDNEKTQEYRKKFSSILFA